MDLQADTEEEFVGACRLALRNVAEAIRRGLPRTHGMPILGVPSHTMAGCPIQVSAEVRLEKNGAEAVDSERLLSCENVDIS